MLNKEAFVKQITLTFFYDSISARIARITLATVTIVTQLVFLTACSLADSSGDDESKSDAVIVDNPVAFIKRPLVLGESSEETNEDNILEPHTFNPGSVLYIKSEASPSYKSVDISSRAFSDTSFLNVDGELLYDVKDLNVSYDGRKLIFTMRAPQIENLDEEEQPKWNIWEYDSSSDTLKRLISEDIIAEDGHDLSPSYLPDGRILFTSTRQRRSKAILLDEGKEQFSALDEDRNQPAFLLHIMNDDGSEIEQITFNQSHDLNPIVLDNGKILFSRWDNAGTTADNGVNLYQINPDGSGLSYMYGRHSHDSGEEGQEVQFVNPVELENGNILVRLREFESQNLIKKTVEVNINEYIEFDSPIYGGVGNGHEEFFDGIDTSGEPSLNGTYGSVFPIYDGTNRYLVSWSVCRLVEIDNDDSQVGDQQGDAEACTESKIESGEYQAAEPLYGLWILNVDDNTQLPIDSAESGQVFDEALLMKSKTTPEYFFPPTLTAEEQILADDGFGILHIKSVYDFDGIDSSGVGISVLADPVQTAVTDLPQRFIRFEKPVSMPSEDVYDFDGSAFGRSGDQSMKEILGYSPIEPDGSVKVAVPANVAFGFTILDEDGRRTGGIHLNWLHLAPGETVECIGCHNGDSDVPHGRFDAQPDAVNTGATTSGLPFPNTETDTSQEDALLAEIEETMAETYARTKGIRRVTPDIIYSDVWTDTAVVAAEPDFSYAYGDLESAAPITASCESDWTSLCRITINYQNHIHPLWSVDRQILDEDGMLVEDQPCTSCHALLDDDDLAMVPAGQLDLSDGFSMDRRDYYESFRELFFNDNELELSEGVLVDVRIDTGEIEMIPEVDEDGLPVLDEDGVQNQVPLLVPLLDDDSNPVLDINGDPVLTTVPITRPEIVFPALRATNALNNTRFLSLFDAGQIHDAYLSPAELKLISEWLDIGAQYYNNPFEAPVN